MSFPEELNADQLVNPLVKRYDWMLQSRDVF